VADYVGCFTVAKEFEDVLGIRVVITPIDVRAGPVAAPIHHH